MNDYIAYIQWGETVKLVLVTIGVFFSVWAYFGKTSGGCIVSSNPNISYFLAAFLVVMLGLYPIPYGSYSDRDIYAMNIAQLHASSSFSFTQVSDPAYYFTCFCLSRFLNVDQTMFALAIIYIGNYFIAIKRMVRRRAVWLLTGTALSMAFISYGMNTMRAGFAISFIVLGLSFYDKFWKMFICLAIAFGAHFSMTIPIIMILLSRKFEKTRLFFYLWILSVPISFAAGNFFNNVFETLSDDNRTQYLTNQSDIYNSGFRIDFIIYSLVPIAIGYYYIFKRKFQSKFYTNIYNAYILTNIFWVLVIRANFSDRFAYLSWFMIPLVIIYPLLTDSSPVKSPNTWLAIILLGETMFKLIL